MYCLSVNVTALAHYLWTNKVLRQKVLLDTEIAIILGNHAKDEKRKYGVSAGGIHRSRLWVGHYFLKVRCIKFVSNDISVLAKITIPSELCRTNTQKIASSKVLHLLILAPKWTNFYEILMMFKFHSFKWSVKISINFIHFLRSYCLI